MRVVHRWSRFVPSRVVDSIRALAPLKLRRVRRLHRRAVSELDAALRSTLFPNLPECDRRDEFLAELLGTSPAEAMYLLDELHRALKVDGDVCEFGVAQGATSALLANELRTTTRHLWLYDSFEGLPKPTDKDVLLDDEFHLGDIRAYEGMFKSSEHEVRERVDHANFDETRLHIVAGFIDRVTTFPDRIAFAYVDFDFYEPIAHALRVVDERMPAGGAMMIDDYGFFSAGAQTAVDE